jgi:hypothetical protein
MSQKWAGCLIPKVDVVFERKKYSASIYLHKKGSYRNLLGLLRHKWQSSVVKRPNGGLRIRDDSQKWKNWELPKRTCDKRIT